MLLKIGSIHNLSVVSNGNNVISFFDNEDNRKQWWKKRATIWLSALKT